MQTVNEFRAALDAARASAWSQPLTDPRVSAEIQAAYRSGSPRWKRFMRLSDQMVRGEIPPMSLTRQWAASAGPILVDAKRD